MNSVQMKKRINISRVLRAVWLNKGISRIEIAGVLGLDKSTITKIISELLDIGIIEIKAEGQASKQGGRRPIQLMINNNFAYVAGIELQPGMINMIISDLDGNVIKSRINHYNIDKEKLINQIVQINESIQKDIEKKNKKLLGIGVGIAGIINPVEGIIYQSIPFGIFEKKEIMKELSNRIEVPVFIENDANCCCWGEIASNKDFRLQNFLFIMSEYKEGAPVSAFDYKGISIGIGIVINGKVYYGNDFSAGEFKSVFWPRNNKSQFSITDESMRKIENDDQVFLEAFIELSKNIAVVVNTFNLSQIYLGGEFEKKQYLNLDKLLKTEIQRNWPYPNEVNCKIIYSNFGDNAIAFGAAGYLLEKLFSIPEIPEGSIMNYIKDNDLLSRVEKLYELPL